MRRGCECSTQVCALLVAQPAVRLTNHALHIGSFGPGGLGYTTAEQASMLPRPGSVMWLLPLARHTRCHSPAHHPEPSASVTCCRRRIRPAVQPRRTQPGLCAECDVLMHARAAACGRPSLISSHPLPLLSVPLILCADALLCLRLAPQCIMRNAFPPQQRTI